MNKLTQWIIIGLLTLNVLGTFLLIRKVGTTAEDTRISILKENMYNKNDIVAELGLIKALIQIKR